MKSEYREIIRRHEDELLNSVVPFWMEYGMDLEHGGYHNSLDREGKSFDQTKFMWMQWRTVWGFAMLYNSEYRQDVFLERALYGAEFCLKQKLEEGVYPYAVGGGGKGLFLVNGSIYAGKACAELFRATGAERFRTEARNCFRHFLAGLKEAEKASASDFFPAMRRRGSYMHLCEVARNLIECGCDENNDMQDAIRLALDSIPAFYCEEVGRWLENLPSSGQLDLSRTAYRAVVVGHDFESMWFMARGAEAIGGHEVLDKIPEWTIRMFDYAADRQYGGLYSFMDALDKPLSDMRGMVKYWWVHNEAMVAAAYCYKMTGDLRFLQRFREVESWSFDHFKDPVLLEWFELVGLDGSIHVPAKASSGKAFFHLPRALYRTIQIFKELDAES